MAKQKQVEAKYYNALIDRQNKVDAWQTEAFLLCFALAVRKAYGWGQERIANGMAAFNAELMRFYNGETPEDLRDELEALTGIWLTFTDDQINYSKRRACGNV